jgi:hypothetical protein
MEPPTVPRYYCKKIENCDPTARDTIFNGCSKCRNGFMHQVVKANGDLTLRLDCSLQIDSDYRVKCFLGYMDGSSQKCLLCQKGYVFNSIQCAVAKAPVCKEGAFVNENIEYTEALNSTQLLSYNGIRSAWLYQGYGCLECEQVSGDSLTAAEMVKMPYFEDTTTKTPATLTMQEVGYELCF